jgi:hypothetical protein
MQVLGGYGISSAPLPGFSHPPLHWANLPITQNVPLRYLSDMLENMGCAPEGTLSILYAKAELLHPKAKKQDRQSLNLKANSLTAPTFLFRGPQFLKYFLDHFPTYMQNCLPPFIMGHSADIPTGPTVANYRSGPTTLTAFLQDTKDKAFTRYTSNYYGQAHKTLHPQQTTVDPSDIDYFAPISKALAQAQRKLPSEIFAAGLRKLLIPFQRKDDLSGTLRDLQAISVTSRNVSPAKRNWTDDQEATPHSAKRRSEAFSKLRVEAQQNLTYTYYPMDTEVDSDEVDESSTPVKEGSNDDGSKS